MLRANRGLATEEGIATTADAAKETLLERMSGTLAIMRSEFPSIQYQHLVHQGHVRHAEIEVYARQSRGALLHGSEFRRIVGSQAPRMTADELHPRVWKSAEALWEDGHFSVAVQRAAVGVENLIQERSGRFVLSGAQLTNAVFGSSEPKAGDVRLRWPGDPELETTKSMNNALRGFGSGCFAGIRNLATHESEEIPRQVALEQLAALSLLARWVDQCVLVQGDPST